MRNFRSNPAQRRDHYQELTDKIIAALEAGTAPWRRPWDKAACGGATAPVNAATGHRYRGINLFVLGMSPLAFASNDSRWCSYRQAAARGWQVRKGEKATPVYFYKPIEIEDEEVDAPVAMAGGCVDWCRGAPACGLVPRSAPWRCAGLERGDDLVGEFLIVVASLRGIAAEVSHVTHSPERNCS